DDVVAALRRCVSPAKGRYGLAISPGSVEWFDRCRQIVRLPVRCHDANGPRLLGREHLMFERMAEAKCERHGSVAVDRRLVGQQDVVVGASRGGTCRQYHQPGQTFARGLHRGTSGRSMWLGQYMAASG